MIRRSTRTDKFSEVRVGKRRVAIGIKQGHRCTSSLVAAKKQKKLPKRVWTHTDIISEVDE